MDYLHATRRAVTIGQGFAMLLMMIGVVWNVWLVLVGFFYIWKKGILDWNASEKGGN